MQTWCRWLYILCCHGRFYCKHYEFPWFFDMHCLMVMLGVVLTSCCNSMILQLLLVVGSITSFGYFDFDVGNGYATRYAMCALSHSNLELMWISFHVYVSDPDWALHCLLIVLTCCKLNAGLAYCFVLLQINHMVYFSWLWTKVYNGLLHWASMVSFYCR